MKRMPSILCGLAILTACNNKSNDIETRVDALYDKMTQEERIMQLTSGFIDDLFDENGNLDTHKCDSLIPNGIGHFCQYASQQPMDPDLLRDRVAAVQNWLINNTPSGIPALFHEEVLSGINTLGATIYPQQIGQAGSFDPERAQLKTLQTSTTLRKMGGVLALSPMVDVCRNPSFNRLEESYGEDSYLSAAMGAAFVRGLQQGDLKKGVSACAKHYLGYGGGGDADEKEMMEEIIMPHEVMIRQEGCKVLMPGYHSVHGINCVANSEILKDILRGYLEFDGMVVSDYTAIGQIPNATPLEQAAMAINAGNDVDFPTGANYKLLQEALDKGLVSEAAFETAVKNVLRHKIRAGLLDDDAYLYATGHIELDTSEERRTAYDIAARSIVLLKNNGTLPLKGNKRILLTGPNANSIWAMCGDYTFPSMNYFWKYNMEEPEVPHIVRLLEAMKTNKPASMEVEYSRGVDWTDTIETKYTRGGDERAWEYRTLHRKVESGETADMDEALRLAREADVIVAAMGENVMLCGENRDREGLRLPGRQEEYLNNLIATGKPVVLVIFGGRAQVITSIADKCAAILQAWYPGEEGGNAVADILYGNISPSAKLSVSYPNVELYEPICYNYSVEKDPRVAWEFGFGLSYSDFEYSNLQVDKEASTVSEGIKVRFDIKNTGKMKAEEVAQIYLSPADENSRVRPIQLHGFARVSLEPGETKSVSVRLFPDQFGYYTNEGKRTWNIDPGKFVVKVGASSADIRLQTPVAITGKKVTKAIRDHYFSEVSVSD